MMVSKFSLILPALLVVSAASAFAPVSHLTRSGTLLSQQQVQRTGSLSNSLSSNVPSDDMLRRDIEAMREEARKRLEHLNHDMEDFISHHNNDNQNEDAFLHKAASFENAQVPKVVVDDPQHHSQQSGSSHPKVPITVKNIPKQQQQQQQPSQKDDQNNHVVAIAPPPHYYAQSKMMHNTRWKIVVQIGTKRQNERYEEKPLLLHLVVDFSADKSRESDDLLQGSAGAKTLVVKEAWIGASSTTEGHQRPVQLKPTGGWKVLPGQGPKGIDILRFYVDVQEEVCHSSSSNLKCPAKRVYCTAGIFPMDHHSESEQFKDYLRSELDQLVHRYEDLTFQDETDERAFSLDRVKRAKQMMDLRTRIRDMNQKITQARIRDPEKSMLRLSRKGDIGVTKDGQVCYRETKGLSSEYIVLGKMEMASIHKPMIESPSSDDNVDELRP